MAVSLGTRGDPCRTRSAKRAAFGKADFLFRKIPFGVGVSHLGVVLLYALLRDQNAKFIFFAAACVPLLAGFGFAADALWRRMHPSQPVLVLSPAGICCSSRGPPPAQRLPGMRSLMPAYSASAHCVAELTLRSGDTALAILRLS